MMSKPLISYAQNREDLILYVLLHHVKNGFYVDVGANDPVIDSVTRFFYEKGWHGINVEPIASLYEQISKNRKRDTNLNIGISNKKGELELREYTNGKHGWSTLSADVKHERRSESAHRDYKVKVKTLKDVFEEQKVKDIDFLKVDVEGFEYEVLSGNDWKKYRPKVIVVENTYAEKWLGILSKAGYQQVHHDGLNRYFVRNDLKDVCTMNDYGPVLLSGIPNTTAYQYSVLKQLKATQKWLRSTQKELSETREKYSKLSEQWAVLNQDPSQVIGFKELTRATPRRVTRKLKHAARKLK